MSLEMPFEMRNITSFPTEKLCYDLKLEVLEEMDAEDTIELAKVNAGFQWMLSRNPWLVFGRHVDEIRLGSRRGSIKKFPGSSCANLDVAGLPLSRRINTCDTLEIFTGTGEFYVEETTILNQLNSVRHLDLHERVQNKTCLQEFFENFRSRVEHSVWLLPPITLKNQVISKLFESFIVNQAKGCEKFYFVCSASAFHCHYEAFAETSIKFFHMGCEELGDFENMVQSLVKKPIPSKNLKATFCVAALCSQEVNDQIVDFLSQFHGMKQLDGESLSEGIKMAIEDLKKYDKDKTEKFMQSSIDFTDGLFFQQNIDSSRDCVYLLTCQPGHIYFKIFFAFYVQLQSQMMEF